MSGLMLPALCIGEQQLLRTAGDSEEGGGTLFPRPSTPQTASAKVLCHMAKFSLAFQDGENKILVLTSAWPLQQRGSGFCQGEIRSDKRVMVHLVAELNCPAQSPTSCRQHRQRLSG